MTQKVQYNGVKFIENIYYDRGSKFMLIVQVLCYSFIDGKIVDEKRTIVAKFKVKF